MADQKVLNLPLDTDEIISIIVKRLEARMRANCFFGKATTYNGFSYKLDMKIKFNDMMMDRNTLVWDQHVEGEVPATAPEETITEDYETSDSPNRTRVQHDLDIPVATTQGRKTIIKKMPAASFKKPSE
jgi:hypothetical protein